MGAVNFSVDASLIEVIKQNLPLEILVETGTFEGDSVKRVQHLFNEIHTVELSLEYVSKAKEVFASLEHVHIYHDNSPSFLAKLYPMIKSKSVLYWLDAHWCVATYTSGEKSQCPLLEELATIQKLNESSVILIDDARLYLCPPPYPHEVSQWPDFNQIMRSLSSLSDLHEVMIFNDTIVFYPAAIRNAISEYAHRNSTDWLSVFDKARDYENLLAQLKEKDVAMQEKDAAMQEKDALIQKHHRYAQELQTELRIRGIQVKTRWPKN